MTRTQMTPKQRRDAQIELRDMARRSETRSMQMDGDDFRRGEYADRAKMLRAVADELDFVPEIQ